MLHRLEVYTKGAIMAVQRNFIVSFGDIFPAGAYAVGEVEPVLDYNAVSNGSERPQKVDDKTNLPMWQLAVLDADPEAKKAQKTVNVKILSAALPVLPEPKGGLPFAAVEFDGLSVTPYVNTNGNRPSLEYSIKATAIRGAGKIATPSATKGE